MKKKLVLLDGNALIHRAFHALPPLNAPSGQLVNAVYGFSLIFLKVLNDLKPRYIACAFDHPKPTLRHKEYQEYKAKRIKKGQELYGQFPMIKEILNSFSVPSYEKEGFEADDIIATLKKRLAPERNLEIIIVTGDLDTLQLVDEKTKVLAMRKGLTDTVLYDEKKVQERFGLKPDNLLDFKALSGDASDNIPGVKGIGEKTACELIQKYSNLETVYQNIDKLKEKVRQSLKQHKQDAFLSKGLVLLKENVPIRTNLRDLEFKNYDPDKVAEIFYHLDFKSLLKRIPGFSGNFSFQKTPETKADEIDQQVEPVLREMEKTGVKLDKNHLNKISQKVNKEILGLKKTVFDKVGGEFNLDSPRQLAQVLFTRLALKITGIKKTKTGISTAYPELLKLKNAHPAIELILKYRELSKLKNTYLDTLVNMTDQKSRLHTTYTQDTQTGRIASKNPNLQNIPIKTELGNEIRKAFLPKSGYKLIAADYSQIELRVIAHLSKDSRMTTAFSKGEDIHEGVCRAMKVDRRTAKMINYGIIYGLSAHGLAEGLGISYQVAQEYINGFFKLHPKIWEFVQQTVQIAKKNGFVETELGRRRYLPEINSPDVRIAKAAERMAINMPNQGLAADILKLAMIKVNPRIKEKGARLILTVHDELVFEVPEDRISEIALIVKSIMEGVYQLSVPLLVEIKAGKNWGEMREVNVK